MSGPTHTIETRHTDMIVSGARSRVIRDGGLLCVSAPVSGGSLTLSPLCPSQHDAQFDYYGKRLATCSSDGTVTIYDVAGSEHHESAVLTG